MFVSGKLVHFIHLVVHVIFQFSMVECLLSAFADEYPAWFTRSRKRSFIYRTLVIISCFLLGIPMVTKVCIHINPEQENITFIPKFTLIDWRFIFLNFTPYAHYTVCTGILITNRKIQILLHQIFKVNFLKFHALQKFTLQLNFLNIRHNHPW